ncbi:MAG: outer membrane beta-barrel protein [Terriglobales bacterium]
MRNRILFLLTFCGLIVSASAQSNFNRFNFTAGGGLGIGRHDVANFVGNSYFEVAGGGVNFSRMFGVDAEYMHYDLGFRPSVTSGPANLNHQSGNMQSISLDGIVTVPRHYGKLGAYGIFGIGFYRRSVSADRQTVTGNTHYQPAWRWWDLTWVDNIPGGELNVQTMSSNSKIAGGFNYGGGVTYRLNHLHNSKLYFEYRYHRAYQSDGQTIVVPITVGLRW